MDITEKEKESVSIEENAPSENDSPSLPDLPMPGTPERRLAERRLVRKLDSRLLPTIVVIYLMNYIDVRQLLPFIDL